MKIIIKTITLFFLNYSSKDENNQQMKRKWKKIRHNVYQMTIGSNITKPTMVFSVIGDSNSSVPRPWQTIVFQKALIEAAKNGGGRVLFLSLMNVDILAFYHIFIIVIKKIVLCFNNNLINRRKYRLQKQHVLPQRPKHDVSYIFN